MSYVKCPDCGRELHVFGESKVKALAAKTGIELLAQIPIERAAFGSLRQGNNRAYGERLS